MSAIDRLIMYIDNALKLKGKTMTFDESNIIEEIRSVAERFAYEEQLKKASGKLGLTDVVSENE